jgi:hypothetical protein
VHDYQLTCLPAFLRGLGVAQPIGFFLHIPFPAAELFARQCLPYALRDQRSFAGGEAGEQCRLRLAGRPGRLGRAVEGDQRPPLLVGRGDQRAQVGDQPGEPALVRGHQRLRLTRLLE